MAKRRSRTLAHYQRQCYKEQMTTMATEIAALEGRLSAILGVSIEELRSLLYGTEYLPPWERRSRLLKAAAGMAETGDSDWRPVDQPAMKYE